MLRDNGLRDVSVELVSIVLRGYTPAWYRLPEDHASENMIGGIEQVVLNVGT